MTRTWSGFRVGRGLVSRVNVGEGPESWGRSVGLLRWGRNGGWLKCLRMFLQAGRSHNIGEARIV